MKIALRSLLFDVKAIAATEFVLVMPVFIALLVASVDIGDAIRTKFKLTESVSSASAYVLANAADVDSDEGAQLASTTASLAASTYAANWANVQVVVNHGPQTSIASGVVSSSGTASNADNTYCPTGAGANLVWGDETTSTCASKAPPGKFVVITASRTFVPLFLPASVFPSPLTETSVVQVQ